MEVNIISGINNDAVVVMIVVSVIKVVGVRIPIAMALIVVAYQRSRLW